MLHKLLVVRWTRDLPKLHGGLDAGPLLIFDQSGSVLVISAFDNFMATSYEHDVNASTVSWGIMGRVDSVPKGFQCSTIMYYGASGINKVMWSLFKQIHTYVQYLWNLLTLGHQICIVGPSDTDAE